MSLAPETAPARTGRPARIVARLLPGGTRLWHFVAFPMLAMGALILFFRLVESALPIEAFWGPNYGIARSVAISAVMAGVITWLALNYRRSYEDKLRARNADLEATREFLSSIIEGSGEAIVTEDARGAVISWNRAAEEMFGWTAREMRGRTLDLLLPPGPGWVEDWRERDARVRAGETLRHHETERVRKDGRAVTVLITRSPLFEPDGGYRGAVNVLRDAGDLQEMQRRLREQERLAAVGQLAATMAHEIKNPLAGIRGGCEIMARAYSADDPRKELADEVLAQVDRLNETTHGLLEFARPRAKHPVATDLHDVLDRAAAVVEEDSRQSEVVVERRYARELPPVRVDPQQIERAVLNLLLNACQAMGGRGRIELTTGRDGSFAFLRVEDDGPGIPPDRLQRIFEPFYTTRPTGTGLGLAIVRNVVLDHGGRIEARARDGESGGACFELYLPLERPARTERTERAG